jgi:threonine aldolase
VIDGLAAAGVLFYRWPETDPAATTIRLVTRHDTDEHEVDALIETARALAAGAADG